MRQSMSNIEGEQRFSARIYKLGINPCVDVPSRVSEAFGKRGYVPVKGTLNGHSIHATLTPKGGGRHRLYINGDMRTRAGVDVSDRVYIVLSIDPQPRKVPMPKGLARALNQNRQAKAAFEQLPPSRQKEILSYLNWLKRPETLMRNIDKVIADLLKRAQNNG
jgi:hypothetical protein